MALNSLNCAAVPLTLYPFTLVMFENAISFAVGLFVISPGGVAFMDIIALL